MDLIMEDPELAKEMLNVLNHQLQRTRQELREAQQRNGTSESVSSETNYRERFEAAEIENRALKVEINDLRKRNVKLQNDNESSRADENADDKSLLQYRISYYKVVEQLQEAVEDTERLIREKDEKDQAQVDLHNQLSARSEKYKQKKSENKRLQTEISEIQAALEILHADLEEVTTERDAALAKSKVLSEENEKARNTRDVGFDPQEFLAGHTVIENQPEYEAMKAIPNSRDFERFAIPKKFEASWYEHANQLQCANDISFIWSPQGISRCVSVYPTCRFNPKSNSGNGVWQRAETPQVTQGQQREVFCADKGRLYYVGRYECVEATTLSAKALLQQKPEFIKHLSASTMLYPALIPPFTARMIPSMYSSGALRAECLVLKCVSFNRSLCQSLLAGRERSKQATVVHKPGSAANKRKSTDTLVGNRNKKAKT